MRSLHLFFSASMVRTLSFSVICYDHSKKRVLRSWTSWTALHWVCETEKKTLLTFILDCFTLSLLKLRRGRCLQSWFFLVPLQQPALKMRYDCLQSMNWHFLITERISDNIYQWTTKLPVECITIEPGIPLNEFQLASIRRVLEVL